MATNGCSLHPGSACMYYKPFESKSYNAAFTDVHQMHCRNVVSFPLCSRTHHQKMVPIFPEGMKSLCQSYISKAFFRGEPGVLPHTSPMFPEVAQPRGIPDTCMLPRRGERVVSTHTVPLLPRRNQLYFSKRASKGIPYSLRYAMTAEKPKWWWRTLACLPYVVPFHAPWMNTETLYQMHPFLEHFDFLTYPFLRAYVRLPSWFLMACVTGIFLGVVKRKECPHFLRFHVVMGILLESSMHIIGTISSWMPCEVFWGKTGLLFWSGIAFAYLFTVLDCARCAVAGKYPDIPILTNSALMHISYP